MTSYIGADVDSKMTDLAIERRRKIVARFCVPTNIAALRGVLRDIPGRKELTFEEGPLAHWLRRNLRGSVDRLVVCDPRRNAYIAKDGDKDDPIDAGKLAELLRGKYLREVYHSDDERRVDLKRWVGLYHDRVGQAVREVNKLRGCCRHYGLRVPGRALRQLEVRRDWLAGLDRRAYSELRRQLEMLWWGLDAAILQSRQCRRRMMQLAKGDEIVGLWQALPGIGPIRAVTLLAYLDTPWRFARPEKLWKYCGVGLERFSSGKDRFGRPKVGRLQLAWQVNKRLKDAVMGATLSAIRQSENPFRDRYERLVADGLTTANARHTVARKLLTVLWGMWKTNRPYDPTRVGVERRGR